METTVTIEGKRILVTGGTGSLGQRVVRRLLDGGLGRPAMVTVLSRDEAKQHEMRLRFLSREGRTDDVIYRSTRGTCCSSASETSATTRTMLRSGRATRNIVIHAAALKQVPTCEYFPLEAVQTNIIGADALVRAAIAATSTSGNGRRHLDGQGMQADQRHGDDEGRHGTRPGRSQSAGAAHPVRLRPLWQRRRVARLGRARSSSIRSLTAGPVTITMKEMTRFLLTLDRAVDTVFARSGRRPAGRDLRPARAGRPHGGRRVGAD